MLIVVRVKSQVKLYASTTMRTSILLVGFLSLASIYLEVQASFDEKAWLEFKEKYGKKYTDSEQESHRRRVFEDNLRFIESHGRLESCHLGAQGANSSSCPEPLSFKQGVNSLSDLTTEEINQSRNGFRLLEDVGRLTVDSVLETLFPSNEARPKELLAIEDSNKAWYENIISPQSIDYRSQGLVSKVKDQGSCGSCWSFATTGALESLLAARNKSVLLSEQNLVDCSQRYGNHGCNGGLMDAALRYVRDHGIMASHEYPYTGRDGTCRFDRTKSVTRVRGSATLPRGNEALLRVTLSRIGPIPIAIDAGSRSFHNYQSGVYNDPCKGNNLNHAVLLVGYGADKTGGDYWIVKNSWGNRWGDNGYIKMARNRGNLCGIASYAVMPIA